MSWQTVTSSSSALTFDFSKEQYGERCSGKWHDPLCHENGKEFVYEAYCEADGVTVKPEGRKVDFLGL